MANWCSTTIKFYSDLETGQVKLFYDYLNLLKPSDGKELFEFYSVLAKAADITIVGAGGYIDFIDEFDCDDNMFQIYTQSRWTPNIEVFRLVLDKMFPDVKLSFIAEEPGCGLFCKYDPAHLFCDNYYYSDDDFTDYYDNEQSIIDFIFDKYMLLDDIDKFKDFVYKHDLDSDYLDNLVTYVNSKDDVYVSVHQFEPVDLFEF